MSNREIRNWPHSALGRGIGGEDVDLSMEGLASRENWRVTIWAAFVGAAVAAPVELVLSLIN